MRRMLLSLMTLAAALVAAAVAAPALVASPHRTVSVPIGENPTFFFVKPHPAVPTVTVHRGDRVRWRWCPDTRGCMSEHNVVGYLHGRVAFKHPRNALSTVGITSGSFSRTFSRKATYRVVCTIHGFSMRLRVT